MNTIPLALEPQHPLAGGPLAFPLRHRESHLPDVEAVFQLNCLTDRASLLSVQILSVAGKDVAESASGFTTSFTQTGEPEILRLQSTARPTTDDESFEASWASPEPGQKLVVESTSSPFPSGMPEDLQEEIFKLDVLRLHLDELKKEIRKQEATIMSIWKSEFSKCSTVKCYFKTALKKVPVLAHLIANHFHHHSHIDVDFFRNATHLNCSDKSEQLLTQPDVSGSFHDELEGHGELQQDDDVEVASVPSPSVEDVSMATSTPNPELHSHHLIIREARLLGQDGARLGLNLVADLHGEMGLLHG